MNGIRQKDRLIWNEDIDWLVNCAPGELGFTGTLQSMIAICERGGASGGTPDTSPFTDQQIGWDWRANESIPGRWRRTYAVWRCLELRPQGDLLAHYSSRNDINGIHRARLEGQIGKLWRAAIWVIPTDEMLEKLIRACMEPRKEGRRGTIDAAIKRATERVSAAHEAWNTIAAAQRAASKADAA